MPYKEIIICVYKILSPDLQECYVGSTTNFLKRKDYHKDLRCTSKKLFEKYGFDNCPFVILEQCTKEELKVKEQWWMDHSVGLVNRNSTKSFDKKEYYEANKEKIIERAVKWKQSKKLKSI